MPIGTLTLRECILNTCKLNIFSYRIHRHYSMNTAALRTFAHIGYQDEGSLASLTHDV